MSSQLIPLVPEQEARNFLATQTMDEARHVEGFQKMLRKIDKVYPMNPYLRMLLNDVAQTQRVEEKVIGMNFLIEGLALTAFNETIKLDKDPLLNEFLRLFVRDEARHVGFAVKYLPTKAKQLPLYRRLQMKVKQIQWLALLDRSVKYHKEEAEAFGVDLRDVMERILTEHQDRLDEMGIDVMINTQFMRHFATRM